MRFATTAGTVEQTVNVPTTHNRRVDGMKKNGIKIIEGEHYWMQWWDVTTETYTEPEIVKLNICGNDIIIDWAASDAYGTNLMKRRDYVISRILPPPDEKVRK